MVENVGLASQSRIDRVQENQGVVHPIHGRKYPSGLSLMEGCVSEARDSFVNPETLH